MDKENNDNEQVTDISITIESSLKKVNMSDLIWDEDIASLVDLCEKISKKSNTGLAEAFIADTANKPELTDL